METPIHRVQGHIGQAQLTIQLLQSELAATNQEVLLLTLELEERVAKRTTELSLANHALVGEIAERKRAEEEIRALNLDLEQRAAQLQMANEELEAFSYSVSHDLRAPLRHIGGFAKMLSETCGDTLSPKGQEYLGHIGKSVATMAQLIDDLLSFARLTRADLQWTTFKVDDLFREVVQEMQHETEGRRVVWRCHSLPPVRADAAMVRQVLVNLISNALKFTRQREQAEIEMGSMAREGELVFFIRDNGVGFDSEHAERLFGVFQRLHSSKEFEGTGVGLANVRRIVARHGGRTWAEAKPGQGATFYFSFPKIADQAEKAS